MDFLLKAWAFLDGKKSLIGAVATAVVVLSDQLGILLPLLGVSAAFYAKFTSVSVLVIGLLHKLVKALG